VVEKIQTLQIGNDWFGERQGGLNRCFAELLKHLPCAGVGARGLVVGSSHVKRETDGMVTGFASPTANLFRRMVAGRQAAMQVLSEGDTDLIASHFALYAIPLLDHFKKFPTVIHFHGPWAAETGAEGQSYLASTTQAAMERAVYLRGQRVIVLSSAFRQELIQRYKVPEDLVRLIPGGIDAERFNNLRTRTEAREQLGWPIDRPIVLSVRRQVRRMGLENLIDAAEGVRRQIPDVLVLLAGSGPISGELGRRIAERGLDEHVRLLGRLEDADLPVAYRAADLTVVPSQTLEGFGMITLESLASGTPVLVTPVGGLPEVILPFAPECVFEDSSSDTIGNLLSEFLSGQRVLPSSTACRNYAVTNFSWPVIAQRTRAVYEEAMQ
jgi:glycosyltransferase involved in cell wall biosynthesis